MQDEQRDLPLDQIVEPWVILRVVDRSSVEYLELRDSIAAVGYLSSICVRPSSRKPGKFEVVVGLHRYAVGCELQRPSIPSIIKYNLTDEDVLALQIQENAVRIETTPMEYARQLKKIMAAMSARQGMDITLANLSIRLHKSPKWVSDQLGLLELTLSLQKAVERGEIPLGSAYALSHVSLHRQAEFADLAKRLPSKEFVLLVGSWVKRFKEAVRKGRLDEFYQEFTPQAHVRSRAEILDEYESRKIAALSLATANRQTPLDAWYLALQWVLHLDPESLNEQRNRVTERLRINTLNREMKPNDEIESDDTTSPQ